MKQPIIKFVAGFAILFLLYHFAEYFVLFQNKPGTFLGIQCAFFLAAFFIAKWQGFSGLSAWGLKRTGSWLLQMIAGMAMGVMLYALTFYITNLLNGRQVIWQELTMASLKPFYLFWFGSLFSSLSEDILTRGYLFKHLRAKFPSGLFIALSAVVYVLNHIYRFHEGWQAPAYLFLLGVLFAIPLVHSGKLWYTAGMHWFGNASFYFTANVLQLSQQPDTVSPNLVFILVILFMIPLQYLLLPRLSFMNGTERVQAFFREKMVH